MSLKQLKSDLQFAKMCHKAHGTDLTELNLKKAQEAYDKAVSEIVVVEESEEEKEPAATSMENFVKILSNLSETELDYIKSNIEQSMRGLPSGGVRLGLRHDLNFEDRPGYSYDPGTVKPDILPALMGVKPGTVKAEQIAEEPAKVAKTEETTPDSEKPVASKAEKEEKAEEKKSKKGDK